MVKILIIGAGLAGLGCARTLTRLGAQVQVLEKSRGLGGRLATRRADPWAFDHGAQYVTVTQPPFLARLTAFLEAGTAATWNGKVISLLPGGEMGPDPFHKPRYVGTPGMNALVGGLADGLDIQTETRAEDLTLLDEGWSVTCDDGRSLGPFDGVVVAVPAPQATALLSARPHMADKASEAVMAPCWAVMAGYDEPLDLCFEGAGVEQSPLSWVAHNAGKPGRGPAESWVLHATPEWSLEHLEDDPASVGPALLAAFHDLVSRDLPQPNHLTAHRWRYARVTKPLGVDCLVDGDSRIAACGDWCLGGRAESAFQSGLSAAHALYRYLD